MKRTKEVGTRHIAASRRGMKKLFLIFYSEAVPEGFWSEEVIPGFPSISA